jgi:hypothetical protein
MVSAMLRLIQQGFTRDAVLTEIARQFKEFRELNEAQLSIMALALEKATGTSRLEWFNALRSAQRMGLINGKQPPPPPPPEDKGKALMWIVLGVGALALFGLARR